MIIKETHIDKTDLDRQFITLTFMNPQTVMISLAYSFSHQPDTNAQDKFISQLPPGLTVLPQLQVRHAA